MKKKLCLFLVFNLLCIHSMCFGAIVADNDGSAFITKAEFDSLRDSFNTQIDNYQLSIDQKIDGAIAAYLAGIKTAIKNEVKFPISDKLKFPFTFYNRTSYGEIDTKLYWRPYYNISNWISIFVEISNIRITETKADINKCNFYYAKELKYNNDTVNMSSNEYIRKNCVVLGDMRNNGALKWSFISFPFYYNWPMNDAANVLYNNNKDSVYNNGLSFNAKSNPLTGNSTTYSNFFATTDKNKYPFHPLENPTGASFSAVCKWMMTNSGTYKLDSITGGTYYEPVYISHQSDAFAFEYDAEKISSLPFGLDNSCLVPFADDKGPWLNLIQSNDNMIQPNKKTYSGIKQYGKGQTGANCNIHGVVFPPYGLVSEEMTKNTLTASGNQKINWYKNGFIDGRRLAFEVNDTNTGDAFYNILNEGIYCMTAPASGSFEINFKFSDKPKTNTYLWFRKGAINDLSYDSANNLKINGNKNYEKLGDNLTSKIKIENIEKNDKIYFKMYNAGEYKDGFVKLSEAPTMYYITD